MPYSTVNNVVKTDEELKADLHIQEMKDIVDSTRSVFGTQFESYYDTTYTQGSPQTVADGVTADFNINASGGSVTDIETGNFPVWDPLTSRLQDLVQDGLYTLVLECDVKPGNDNGETLFTLVEIDGLVNQFLISGPVLDNIRSGVYQLIQAVFVVIGGSPDDDFSFKFTVSSNQMTSSIASRRLTILRSM